MPTGYWLLDHQNPNAPERDDGRRFWGHASRRQKLRTIGVHTAEIAPSGSSAEDIANYFTHSDRAASYHWITDSNSDISLLPEHYTAFGIQGHNSPCYQVSFATRADEWGGNPEWDELSLRRAAKQAAYISEKYEIPLRWLTRRQADNGERGFVRHSVMDPDRRFDPGDKFPADKWFSYIREELASSRHERSEGRDERGRAVTRDSSREDLEDEVSKQEIKEAVKEFFEENDLLNKIENGRAHAVLGYRRTVNIEDRDKEILKLVEQLVEQGGVDVRVVVEKREESDNE